VAVRAYVSLTAINNLCAIVVSFRSSESTISCSWHPRSALLALKQALLVALPDLAKLPFPFLPPVHCALGPSRSPHLRLGSLVLWFCCHSSNRRLLRSSSSLTTMPLALALCLLSFHSLSAPKGSDDMASMFVTALVSTPFDGPHLRFDVVAFRMEQSCPNVLFQRRIESSV
jgi:hypothetical protein